MSEPPATPSATSAELFASSGPEHCIVQDADGVFLDPAALGSAAVAAVDAIWRGGSYFAGLDYAVLVKALFDCGPAIPAAAQARGGVRIARAIAPFDPARRDLYHAVKILDGRAEYWFEPVFLTGPEGEEVAASLDVDEFIADMWLKGIRFGVDVAAVQAAIAGGHSGRIVVARRLEPLAGQDAVVVEVSDDIHRSNAPLQLSNGKLDLMRFQNRFPQVEAGTCLLRKLPPRPGMPGFELSGIRIAPTAPRDLDFNIHAGAGTRIERNPDGDILVAVRTGFLSVDPKTHAIAIDDKVVSHDGVSVRTTGNLKLNGDYEEFGEVQEMRVLEGNGIVVHGHVFGKVVSRGGDIHLCANLMGGSARNVRGDIRVDGVAAGAVIAAAAGTVTLARAENCVIAGTRICIEEAINCEIVGEEVTVGLAAGCAIAGLRVAIDSSAPWRDSEMLVYVLCGESERLDAQVARAAAQVAEIEALVSGQGQELAQLCEQPAVRQYVDLATAVRSGATVLDAVQAMGFQRLEQAVTPQLRRIATVNAARKAAEAEKTQAQAQLAQAAAQRSERIGASAVTLKLVQGETLVRRLAFDPDAGAPYLQPARAVRQRLRGSAGSPLHAATSGSYHWQAEPA